MTSRIDISLRVAVAAALLGAGATATAQDALTWQTVVNNNSYIPDTADRQFNSYGQPSVNARGLVVFRGRSTGQGMGPVRGVYARDMEALRPVREFGAAGDPVPDPNNVVYDELLAPFNEFPSFPRIDIGSSAIASRGQSRPVWEYPVGEPAPEGEETEVTRVGTSGIYVERMPVMTLSTGASQLGVVPGFEYFAVPVPGLAPNTRFDQFPGSPAVMSRDVIAFKGNYTDTNGTTEVEDDTAYTGVFFRNVRAGKGLSPVQFIASSQVTAIPGTDTLFASTAPPSAADGNVFFVGSDNEQSPTLGGIYRVDIKAPTTLEPVLEIGEPVPGVEGATFAKFGESLSIGSRGRHVAFWAGWGGTVDSEPLYCPDEGNKDRVAYCKEFHDGETVEMPEHQGIFVYDTKTGALATVATTNGDAAQFLYCIFSGRPPGSGGGHGGHGSEEGGDEGDYESARWRCSAFAALSSLGTDWYQVAYKATLDDGTTGIYLWDSTPGVVTQPVLEVGDGASALDPEAPALSTVVTLGIERDGFRKGWLALTASMAAPPTGEEEEAEGMAGVYVTRVPGWDDPELDAVLLQVSGE